VRELVQKGYKIVVCLGGELSNTGKREELKELGDKFEEFKGIPIHEVGIKPLNKTQLDEVFQFAQMEREKLVRGGQERPFSEEESSKISQSWHIVKQLSLTEAPIPYHAAEFYAKQIIYGKGRCDNPWGSGFVEAKDSEEKWKTVLVRGLEDGARGSILGISAIKEMIEDGAFE